MKLTDSEIEKIVKLVMAWKRKLVKQGIDIKALASGYGHMRLMEKIYLLGKKNN